MSSATITVGDDEGMHGITVESMGYSNHDLAIALVTTAECMIQNDVRELLKDDEDWQSMTESQRSGLLILNSRLLMFDLLSNMDPTSSVGVHLDLS